ncbi:MAG: NADH-quinone oxidoreductase subunit J [Candidatus Sericytochromatia bacterium]|nr:NADH-quinone oxidoreductase subunit J [Candidatus Sericytochromatia bacterium]
MAANTIFFMIFSLVAIISGFVMITRRHPLSAALSLVVTFISLAGLYGLLAAKLLFIIQILVYAGAIMTLVIFSIMLLNVQEEDLPAEERIIERVSITTLILLPMIYIIGRSFTVIKDGQFPEVSQDFGTIHSVGMFLFTTYSFPFEVISILLLISLLGVVVLAKRRI